MATRTKTVVVEESRRNAPPLPHPIVDRDLKKEAQKAARVRRGRDTDLVTVLQA